MRAVAKFGGSSVKDAEAIMRSVKIVANDSHVKMVVVSATQHTTNQLEEVAKAAEYLGQDKAYDALSLIWTRHESIARELGVQDEAKALLGEFKKELENLIQEIVLAKKCTPKQMDHIYSFGERISSALFAWALQGMLPDQKVVLVEARKLIKTNSDYKRAIPFIQKIKNSCHLELESELLDQKTVFVTQGFLGEGLEGEWTTLGREGSDYTAVLLGEAIGAKTVQIWTDVPGIATTDPRLVSNSKTIQRLSYDEATAMARLGAKLFSETLVPAKRAGLAVFVGSTFSPQKGGTWIGDTGATSHPEMSLPLASLAVMDELTRYEVTTNNFSNVKDFLSTQGLNFYFWGETKSCCRFYLPRRRTIDSEGLKKLQDLGTVTMLANQTVLSLVGNKASDSDLRARLWKFLEKRLITPLPYLLLKEDPFYFSFTSKELDSTELTQAAHDFLLAENAKENQ